MAALGLSREDFAAQLERGAAQAAGQPVTESLLRWTAEPSRVTVPRQRRDRVRVGAGAVSAGAVSAGAVSAGAASGSVSMR